MRDKEEKLAIMKGVGFGNRDVGFPVLFFTAMTSECSGALQIMSGKEAMDFIKDYGVYDVKHMEGKPVWVEQEGGLCGIIRVSKPWKE